MDRMQTHPPPNYPPPPPPVPGTETATPVPRPTTPRSAKSPAPESTKSPEIAQGNSLSPSPNPNSSSPSGKSAPARRTSLSNLLRRSKSSERGPPKKLSKKSQPPVPSLPKSAPRLPEIPVGLGVAAGSKTLGEAASAYENATRSLESGPQATTRPSVDIPSIKRGFNINEDPYSGVGSITNRGRYSYASSAVSTINSPRRLRKRKDPVPFK